MKNILDKSKTKINSINIHDKLSLTKIKEKYRSLSKEQIRYGSIGVSVIVLIFILAIYNTFYRTDVVKTIAANDAEAYYYEADYDKAIEEYLSYSSKNPDEVNWYVKIAEVYSVKGDLENSRKYLQQAKNIIWPADASSKKSTSDDVKVINYIVFTEFMNKDFSEALTDGKKALETNKDNKALMQTMLSVYMANGDAESAKLLVQNYPVDKKSSYDIAEHARMIILLGQWDEGLKELKDAWTLDKDEYKVYDVLSQIAIHDKDKLLEKISQLANDNPEELSYQMWLAKLYSFSSDSAEIAQSILDQNSGKAIGQVEKDVIQISIYENTSQTEKADELINTLLKNNKKDYRVLHISGWYYLQKGDYEKALEYCNKSIVYKKDYVDNYAFLMPAILNATEKSAQSEAYYRTALQKEPYNYNIMLSVANYYWDTIKNTEKSLEYYGFAEILQPQDSEIKYSMALINLNNNNKEKAIELLKEAINFNPSIPKYHRTLGTIYVTQEKYGEAITEIRNAYEADKEDILTLNNAGCYYTMVDVNLDKAKYNLQKAYDGINDSTDEYTKTTITDNYNKLVKFIEDYNSGSGGELRIPEMNLFY